MIEVNNTVKIPEEELQFAFIRSSGPGGQNVNKVSTAVQLRFDVLNSPSLMNDVKERLIRLAGNKMTDEGVLIIVGKQYRTQEQNRYDAVERLVDLIHQALVKPRIRKSTRPSVTSKAHRVAAKREHGDLKRLRTADPETDFEDWYFDDDRK